jgi:hypothetical protein
MSAAPALKPTIYRVVRAATPTADEPFQPPAEWGIRMEVRDAEAAAGGRAPRRPSLV